MEQQSQPSESTKLTWDYNECAKRIGISRRTLSRLVAAGKIPVIRANSRILFRPEAIEQWLRATEEQPD